MTYVNSSTVHWKKGLMFIERRAQLFSESRQQYKLIVFCFTPQRHYFQPRNDGEITVNCRTYQFTNFKHFSFKALLTDLIVLNAFPQYKLVCMIWYLYPCLHNKTLLRFFLICERILTQCLSAVQMNQNQKLYILLHPLILCGEKWDQLGKNYWSWIMRGSCIFLMNILFHF